VNQVGEKNILMNLHNVKRIMYFPNALEIS